MSKMESFVNGREVSAQPLEIAVAVAPASCFWAAFNGAAVGILTADAVNYVVNHYVKGGIVDDEAPETTGGVALGLSSDRLNELAGSLHA
jgi:hypothetical protein